MEENCSMEENLQEVFSGISSAPHAWGFTVTCLWSLWFLNWATLLVAVEGLQWGHKQGRNEKVNIPRAPKSPNDVSSTFFNALYLLPKDLRFEHGGAKLASCPGRQLTSLRLWAEVWQRHDWKALNALFSSFVSFHYKRHNQNKTYTTKSLNKLVGRAYLRWALSSTKPWIKLLVSKNNCILPIK